MKKKFRISWFIRISPNKTVNQEVIADEDTSYYIVRSILSDPSIGGVRIFEYEAEQYSSTLKNHNVALILHAVKDMSAEEWLKENFDNKIERVFEGRTNEY